MLNFFKNKTDFSDAEKGVLYAPYVKNRIDKKEIENTFTRLFLTDDGQKVLSYLQLITYHRASGPTSSDEQLRFMEGQRALLTTILRLVNNGRAQ
ncbi:MAG: hypothetical protein AAF182_00665 [Pseudomonadota bacterium]